MWHVDETERVLELAGTEMRYPVYTLRNDEGVEVKSDGGAPEGILKYKYYDTKNNLIVNFFTYYDQSRLYDDQEIDKYMVSFSSNSTGNKDLIGIGSKEQDTIKLNVVEALYAWPYPKGGRRGLNTIFALSN